MALSCFVDAFNIGTGAVASTVVRTGYGFQPKACLYVWGGSVALGEGLSPNTDLKAGMGMATSATDRRCMTIQSDHGANTMATDRKHNDAQVIECLTIAGAVDGNADLQSFDSDGQTLVIDDQFTTNIRVMCLALGGTDLTNVATLQFQAPLTIGTQDITSLAFQPDAVLLCSVGHATAPPAVTTNNLLSIGWATTTGQAVCASYDNDASGSSDTASYARADECIALFASSALLNWRASFNSFLSNGFRLSWAEVAIGQPYIFGLALQGGNYRAGSFTTSTTLNATQAQTGFGFAPTGALFLSHAQAVSTADTAQAGVVGSVGAMSSATNRGGMSWYSGDAQGTAVCAAGYRTTAVVELGSQFGALDSLVDISSMDSDGFTTIIDDAGTAANIFYLAFGSSGGAPPTPAILRQMMHQHGG